MAAHPEARLKLRWRGWPAAGARSPPSPSPLVPSLLPLSMLPPVSMWLPASCALSWLVGRLAAAPPLPLCRDARAVSADAAGAAAAAASADSSLASIASKARLSAIVSPGPSTRVGLPNGCCCCKIPKFKAQSRRRR